MATRSHTMTPARRAALRKAQLASAAKRRRSQGRYRRQVPSHPKLRKAVKYTAIGAGAVGAVILADKGVTKASKTKMAHNYTYGRRHGYGRTQAARASINRRLNKKKLGARY